MPLNQFLPRLDVRIWSAMIACNQLEISKKQKRELQRPYHSRHRHSDKSPFFRTEFMVSVPHIRWHERWRSAFVFIFKRTCSTLQCYLLPVSRATRAGARLDDVKWRQVISLPICHPQSAKSSAEQSLWFRASHNRVRCETSGSRKDVSAMLAEGYYKLVLSSIA